VRRRWARTPIWASGNFSSSSHPKSYIFCELKPDAEFQKAYVEGDTSGRIDIDEETCGRIVQGNSEDKLIDAREMSDERLINIWKISGAYVDEETSIRTDVEAEINGSIIQGKSDERLSALRKMCDERLGAVKKNACGICWWGDENEIHARGEKSVHELLVVEGEMERSRAVVGGGGGGAGG
jgi:hypothetical protein